MSGTLSISLVLYRITSYVFYLTFTDFCLIRILKSLTHFDRVPFTMYLFGRGFEVPIARS